MLGVGVFPCVTFKTILNGIGSYFNTTAYFYLSIWFYGCECVWL